MFDNIDNYDKVLMADAELLFSSNYEIGAVLTSIVSLMVYIIAMKMCLITFMTGVIT